MIDRRLDERFTLAGLLLFASAVLIGPATAHSDEDSRDSDRDSHRSDRDSHRFGIETLSNRADLISGGDALVEV